MHSKLFAHASVSSEIAFTGMVDVFDDILDFSCNSRAHEASVMSLNDFKGNFLFELSLALIRFCTSFPVFPIVDKLFARKTSCR